MSEMREELRVVLFLVRLLLLSLVMGGAGDLEGVGLRFSEVTEEAGIVSEYGQEVGLSVGLLNYEWMVGGAVAEDFDGDGWIDIYILQGGVQANELYMNRGDGTFVEEALERGAGLTGVFAGATAADYDSDGDVDIFITNTTHPHYLLKNEGQGAFEVEEIVYAPVSYASSPSWGDVNNDGLLDLAFGAWVLGAEDIGILRNTGEGFVFSQSLPKSYNFVAAFADLDGDRYQDLLAVADFSQASWYRNNGFGIFLPTASFDIDFGMGCSTGDIDNDGDLDVFMTSIYNEDDLTRTLVGSGNRLYLNDGQGGLSDISAEAEVREGFWGWGSLMGDFDNDGDLDIYHVNGYQGTLGSSASKSFVEEPARLFENLGNLKFNEIAEEALVADRGQGRSALVLDYDNDGDLDIFITNSFEVTEDGEGGDVIEPGRPKLFRNDSDLTAHWLQVELRGQERPHHSLGIGARVIVESGGVTQMRELNASSGYNGHGPNRIAHFGLGEESVVNRIRARWTNGDETWIENVEADRRIVLSSPLGRVSSRSLLPREPFTVSYPVDTIPDGLAVWTVNGVGYANVATVSLEEPGEHYLRVDVYSGLENSLPIMTEWIRVVVEGDPENDYSIARIWNEEILSAIRIDFPNPAVHARNLFHLSVAMWDSWAAFDSTVDGYLFHEKLSADDVEAARHEAISYAAYRILSSRYSQSVNASTTQALLLQRMLALGYDVENRETVGSDPAAVGNRIAARLLSWAINDGCRETAGYTDPSYTSVNEPLDLEQSGTALLDFNRWQPLKFQEAMTQNGLVTSDIQIFQGSHWGWVRPFAMRRNTDGLYYDPGPPPLLGTPTEDAYVAGNVDVILKSSWLDPDDGEVIDISPASRGLNPLGTNDGLGHGAKPNPATGRPYVPNWVKRGDFSRVIAEFWADGPDSETPPGHWNTLANAVSDHPDQMFRYRGSGSVLERLEWDVRLYFMLNGALHDAAIAAWGCKRYYDYIRPISSIRYLGEHGKLPEVPGLIERITPESSAVGSRHHAVFEAGAELGETVLYAWGGEPENPKSAYTGRKWIRAVDWVPYQRDTFVTPAFAGYVSGHSAFSRSAAEVLTWFTGSEYFPGGMATHTVRAGGLEFEQGPTETITLQWARYFDASDEAGLSRVFGGIHVPADDLPGRLLGARAGQAAIALAERYFFGEALEQLYPPDLRIEGTVCRLLFEGLPGLTYQIQMSEDLDRWVQIGSEEPMLERFGEVQLAPLDADRFFRVLHRVVSSDPGH